MKQTFTILLSLLFFLSLFFIIAVIFMARNSPSNQIKLTLAPESELPDFLHDASTETQEAYRFAIANPDILKQYPCYCGCSGLGHKNNLECYIKQFNADGSIEFDNHAFGWGICVDITRDVMKLMRQGKDHTTIRAYIENEYSRLGPSTDDNMSSETNHMTCSTQENATCSDTPATDTKTLDLNAIPEMTVPEVSPLNTN